MRGSLTLFADIFEQPTQVVESAKKKGRSAHFNDRRNELLVARYYYYGKFTKDRYSEILETLSNEFFLSTITIPEVLSDNATRLRDLAKQAPDLKYFSKKWPHLVW